MRLRLTGTHTETAALAEILRQVLAVREQSPFYPNRGRSVLGRVYLDVDLTTNTRHNTGGDTP